MEKQNRFGVSVSLDLGIAEIVGFEAAVIYNELRFWSDKGSQKDGWVYKTYSEMLAKFPISEYHLRKSYKLLEKHGIIETKIMKVDGVPTFHYRFLKFFSFHSENFSVSMDSENFSETYIYTDNNHNTENSESVSLPKPNLGEIENGPLKSSAVPSEADFRAITKKLGESDRVRYLDDRKRVFLARLKNFTMDEIFQAADNLSKSEFHMGKNEQKTKYADFDFLMRNDKQLDKWLNKTPPVAKKSAF